ncbi:NUDIX hydrolase domain-like protein [Nemania abortiva]|nr:NUDIX hydrolase domain-like protein [Nemania abortiva]
MAERPVFSFDYDSSLAGFAVSKRAYLDAHPDASFDYIATSALVLDSTNPSNPRILLVQRAASDSYPNKWEPPGGGCDDTDETILYAAARELWEEAGLEAARIVGLVGEPHFFTLRNGNRVCQFNFAVHAKADPGTPLVVRLDPKEHQRFVWATEGEVKAKKADGIELDFTTEGVERTVLLVFEYFRNNQADRF